MSKYKFAKPIVSNKTETFNPFQNPNPSEKEIWKAQITADVIGRVEKEVLPTVRKESEAKGWLEGEQYSNFQNALTFIVSLHRLFDFSSDDCIAVIQESNKLVEQINDGSLKLHTLIKEIKDMVYFDKSDIALAKQYKTF